MNDSIDKAVLKLAEYLMQHGLRLATAESCTGGMVSAAITALPGSSQWFDSGFVTYSNQAKQVMLGVQAGTLEKYGAVSEQVVLEMAKGAVQRSEADVVLAVSGIAGPDGGSVEKPVGTVCFAWVQKNNGQNSEQGQLSSSMVHFEGGREEVRKQAVLYALEGVLALLQD